MNLGTTSEAKNQRLLPWCLGNSWMGYFTEIPMEKMDAQWMITGGYPYDLGNL